MIFLDDDDYQMTSDPADGTLGDLMRGMADAETREMEEDARLEKENDKLCAPVLAALNKIVKHLGADLSTSINPKIHLNKDYFGNVTGFQLTEDKIPTAAYYERSTNSLF